MVAFVFAHRADALNFRWQFDLTFSSLAVANVYYTCFAHGSLTRQRQRRQAIRRALQLEATEDTRWSRGFWSHLFPFFAATFAVAAFGFFVLHSS